MSRPPRCQLVNPRHRRVIIQFHLICPRGHSTGISRSCKHSLDISYPLIGWKRDQPAVVDGHPKRGQIQGFPPGCARQPSSASSSPAYPQRCSRISSRPSAEARAPRSETSILVAPPPEIPSPFPHFAPLKFMPPSSLTRKSRSADTSPRRCGPYRIPKCLKRYANLVRKLREQRPRTSICTPVRWPMAFRRPRAASPRGVERQTGKTEEMHRDWRQGYRRGL